MNSAGRDLLIVRTDAHRLPASSHRPTRGQIVAADWNRRRFAGPRGLSVLRTAHAAGPTRGKRDEEAECLREAKAKMLSWSRPGQPHPSFAPSKLRVSTIFCNSVSISG